MCPRDNNPTIEKTAVEGHHNFHICSLKVNKWFTKNLQVLNSSTLKLHIYFFESTSPNLNFKKIIVGLCWLEEMNFTILGSILQAMAVELVIKSGDCVKIHLSL